MSNVVKVEIQDKYKPSIMKKIIGLYGRANCGKSTSLNMLKDKLRQHGESLATYPHHNEVQELFRYRDTLVCVAPGGDDGEVMNTNISYFRKSGCEIAVSGSRTKGDPVININKYAREFGQTVRWFNMPYCEELPQYAHPVVDNATADAILASIDRAIAPK